MIQYIILISIYHTISNNNLIINQTNIMGSTPNKEIVSKEIVLKPHFNLMHHHPDAEIHET